MAATEDGDTLIFPCPHCGLYILVPKQELRCKIFRHGAHKRDQEPLPPHSSQEDCERLAGDMYGCSKPFRIVVRDGAHYPERCGYL